MQHQRLPHPGKLPSERHRKSRGSGEATSWKPRSSTAKPEAEILATFTSRAVLPLPAVEQDGCSISHVVHAPHGTHTSTCQAPGDNVHSLVDIVLLWLCTILAEWLLQFMIEHIQRMYIGAWWSHGAAASDVPFVRNWIFILILGNKKFQLTACFTQTASGSIGFLSLKSCKRKSPSTLSCSMRQTIGLPDLIPASGAVVLHSVRGCLLEKDTIQV